ncbi:molybdenum cofactor synthesis domain protein [Methylocella silvestris BL2]|uniref:Molybdopterin molybdenumtransferase n=1 Tax=Methylocella silvestris (strain DSM 15510 / CIP 108128 / LMG 27833 / NCIMB 13906 / BL2) TaxID=395965 RepID=B8EJZ8_METSB|nr:gephyrin-like molybdotransferase Glp [Methylocella silvestris]ACK49945.1 molybdenum cofactor synthesis domain protein [Methylocella silvestris BL2]
MTQLGQDIFAAGEKPMRVEEAAAWLVARAPATGDLETVSIFEADGRILAHDLTAPLALPGFDNSAVDGYAVAFKDLATAGESVLPIGGRMAAGRSFDPAGGDDLSGTAVRIFTGAMMPPGMNTVFMQEDCRLTADGRVVLPPGLKPGDNRRLRGEDIDVGALAIAAGRRLAPEDIGLAAALGLDRLTVRRRLKAAIFSTGDELVCPVLPRIEGALQAPDAYDANRFLLCALLRRQGLEVTDLGILPDDKTQIAAALRKAAKGHDLIVSSGGVSVGEEDHVKAAILEQGSLHFWRLAIKPGRPLAMGVIDGAPFIGLPGNPVAAFIGFVFVARALIAALSGARFEAPLAVPVASGFAYRKKAGRREFLRASLFRDASGVLTAEKYAGQGAAVLTSLTRTRGFVDLPEEAVEIAPGDRVNFIDYDLIR